jgi:hypothetical protein
LCRFLWCLCCGCKCFSEVFVPRFQADHLSAQGFNTFL